MDDLHEGVAALTCGASGGIVSLSESQGLRADDTHADDEGASNKTVDVVTPSASGDEPSTIESEPESAAEGEHEQLEVCRAPYGGR